MNTETEEQLLFLEKVTGIPREKLIELAIYYLYNRKRYACKGN